VGKTVICRRLVEGDPALVRSVSATTRPPRAEERDGVDYSFWDEPRFRKAIEQGGLLEWAEVYGYLYGTPREPIERHLREGRCPVLNIDVQGGRSVKRLYPDAVLIFLVPPSAGELEARLRGRGTDPADVIEGRLATAVEEMKEWIHYDYLVKNDDLDEAMDRVRAIVSAERARTGRRRQGREGASPG
jgi:guanylate kinase